MNRREALCTIGTGTALTALGAVIVVATSCAPTKAPAAEFDPLLDLIERYRAQTDIFNKLPDMSDAEQYAQIEATYGPLMDELCDSPPPATTMHGAIEAIRFALEEMDHSVGGYALPVLGQVLAFLKGRA